MQKNAFLINVIIPFHKSQVLVDDNFILYDINGRILVTSNRIIKHLGFKNDEDILGKNMFDLGHATPLMTNELIKLFMTVRDKKEVITFLTIGGQTIHLFKNHHEIVMQRYEPIIDLDQNVVAIIARGFPILDDPLINLALNKFKSRIKKETNLSETLSIREFEIFYLLSHGISQYKIATILKITRSTVAKTIERICDKLKLDSINSQELIKLSIAMGMNNKIPKSLVSEKLVIISCK